MVSTHAVRFLNMSSSSVKVLVNYQGGTYAARMSCSQVSPTIGAQRHRWSQVVTATGMVEVRWTTFSGVEGGITVVRAASVMLTTEQHLMLTPDFSEQLREWRNGPSSPRRASLDSR